MDCLTSAAKLKFYFNFGDISFGMNYQRVNLVLFTMQWS